MFLCFDGLLTWNCLGEDWIMELRLGKFVGKYVRIVCSTSYVRCLCQVPSKCLPIPQISSSSSSRALFPELWPLRITSAGSRALWHQAGQPHQWGALGRRLEVRREESVTRVFISPVERLQAGCTSPLKVSVLKVASFMPNSPSSSGICSLSLSSWVWKG